MPLYEYECEKCGEQFEVMQKFSDTPLTTHEKCGGRVNRLLSAPALQFKGSGWYITDYARAKSADKSSDNGSPGKTDAPAAKTSGGSESGSASSSESKSETKSTGSETK
jgi:putative FmdB family regulatory protein